ncbi:MAG: hypothetical protein LBU42_04255 [Prevotellaceae bacterium]|nr:hypothetical protein [Prevotellaceae bacterium]
MAVLLLPTFLRRPLLVAFLHSGVAPVMSLHRLFMLNRTSSLYRLRMSAQVCYLRRMLNDAFPSANNAIQIRDADRGGRWLFACDADVDRTALSIEDGGTVFYDRGAIIERASGFEVVVPVALKSPHNDMRLRVLLNQYKLLSKKYEIVYE